MVSNGTDRLVNEGDNEGYELKIELGLCVGSLRDDDGFIDVGKVNHNLEVDGGKTTTPKIVLLLVIILKSYLLITANNIANLKLFVQ